MKVKIIIREHNGYTEFKRAEIEARKRKIKLPIKQYFGQFQYLFCANRKVVSLVQLWDIFNECWFWEIYCLKGKLFDDVERFATIEDAQKRIWELLTHPMISSARSKRGEKRDGQRKRKGSQKRKQ